MSVETGDLEVVREVREKVSPQPGDVVELRCEGVISQVLGDEIEVGNLTVVEVAGIRREGS